MKPGNASLVNERVHRQNASGQNAGGQNAGQDCKGRQKYQSNFGGADKMQFW